MEFRKSTQPDLSDSPSVETNKPNFDALIDEALARKLLSLNGFIAECVENGKIKPDQQEDLRTALMDKIKSTRNLPFRPDSTSTRRNVLVDLDRTLIDTDHFIELIVTFFEEYADSHDLPNASDVRQQYKWVSSNANKGFYSPEPVIREFINKMGWNPSHFDALLVGFNDRISELRFFEDGQVFLTALRAFFGSRYEEHVKVFTTGEEKWQLKKVEITLAQYVSPNQVSAHVDKTLEPATAQYNQTSVIIDDRIEVLVQLMRLPHQPDFSLFWINRGEIEQEERARIERLVPKSGRIIEIKSLDELIPLLCPDGETIKIQITE